MIKYFFEISKLSVRCLLFLCVFIPNLLLAQSGVNLSNNPSLKSLYYSAENQPYDVIHEFDIASPINDEDGWRLLINNEVKRNIIDASIIHALEENTNKQPFAHESKYLLAEYYFYTGDTLKSIEYINQIEPAKLNAAQKTNYYWYNSVLMLQAKKYDQAKEYLTLAEKNSFGDEKKLLFSKAFADYYLGKQSVALSGFEKSIGGTYNDISRFFISKINFDEGEYDKVIAFSEQDISDEKTLINSYNYQLIGESYAKKDDIKNAARFFSKAVEVSPHRPSPTLFYQLGISKFKLGQEEEALKYLEQAGIGAGPYAILSALQLGRIYLNKKDYEKSLTAYIEAATSADIDVREEAYCQITKLHAHIGNYTDAMKYADDYLLNFPEGKNALDVNSIIAQIYLKNTDYDLSLQNLEKLGLKTKIAQSVYQKVAFQKAQLLFNDSNFEEAIIWFQNSKKYPIEKSLVNEAYFLIGEAHMALQEYDLSIEAYKKQIQPDSLTQYGLGYAYYNKKDYVGAKTSFGKYIQATPSGEFLDDAILRLADCQYATKAYEEALETYQKVSPDLSADYVKYQLGLVQRNLGMQTEAIQSFKDVPKYSDLYEQALFQEGLLRFEQGDFWTSESNFTQLINTYPSSLLLSQVYLKRGMSKYNTQRLEESMQDFKYIIDYFIDSEEAFSALLTLREIQRKGIEVEEMESHTARYKQANPNDESLEVLEFEDIKSKYFNLEYEGAITKLIPFIRNYSKSSFLSEAKYYLADSYFRLNQLAEAEKTFDEIKHTRSNLTGRILNRLGDINYTLGNYDKAKNIYNVLLSVTRVQKDVYNARLGLVKSYFQSKDYDEVLKITDNIINADWKPLNAERLATMYKAKVWQGIDSTAMAIEAFTALAMSKDVLSAEAQYHLALIAHNRGDYEASNEKLFVLNSKFGSYHEWINKSYLLVAENYLKSNELFKAKATLLSIIEHSEDENSRKTAKEKLGKIENQDQIQETNENEK